MVELLAVIVILGLLMAIAIPSVTKYITQSRKKTLVNSIDSYITATTTAVNNNEFGALSDQDVIYYIPVNNDASKSCVSLEKGGTDPFGNWKEAYVAVNYDADKYSYDYFFTFYDDAGYGMALTKSDDIKPSGDGQIINPTPVDADSITTQLGGRATNVKVLVAGSCKVSNAINGGVQTPEVTYAAVFEDYTDGDVYLTWEELKNDENGSRFDYRASAISDTEIGEGAFALSQSLKSIILPDGIKTIGNWSFTGIGDLNITIPTSVTSIGDGAFWFNECLDCDPFPLNITYKGTKAQWNAIHLGEEWYYSQTQTVTVICTDGTLVYD